MKRLPALAASLLLAACATAGHAPSGKGDTYDLVITHAKIVDGTGNPWFYGDVAVHGDRIVRVAPDGALRDATAGTRVDAHGMVLAPGFIDMQGQSYELLTGDGRDVSKITQGVTTEILGEGDTPAPVNDKILATLSPTDTADRRILSQFTGPHGFGHWLDAMQAHGMSVNVGSFVGAATVRVYAKGEATGEPNAAELDTMRAVVKRAMEDGAFGFASALIYPAGSFAGTNELTEMAKAMAPYHGVYITHMRSEENTLLEAIDEAMSIGRNGGVPVEIYHLKAAGPKNWAKAPAMVAKIDSARNAGQDVGATMYPYSASGNNLSACIPQWASADGKLMANLKDSATRAKIVHEVADTGPGSADLCQGLADRIMVVGLVTPAYKQYDGWRMDKIAAAMNMPWNDALVTLVIAEDNKLGKITFSMTEENVSMQLARPWVLIGTDAGGSDPDSSHDIVHPRGYGSYPKILGRYVREQHLLTLEDAVRKMSSGPAARLSLFDRGVIREGMFADLVLFDPATVIDKATFEKPHQLSVGILNVWVNGVMVVHDGKPTGAKPGRALRGPGWTP
jgi:dihydroorotase/N-acyl-D-amino-acid deacylase